MTLYLMPVEKVFEYLYDPTVLRSENYWLKLFGYLITVWEGMVISWVIPADAIPSCLSGLPK